MKFINLTPHVVRLNDGTEFPPNGNVARVTASYTEFDENGICSVHFGEVTGLPCLYPCSRCDGCGGEPGWWEHACEQVFIVSAMVMQACPDRNDLVSPATGHPDAIRKDGQIVSVPGFIRAK